MSVRRPWVSSKSTESGQGRGDKYPSPLLSRNSLFSWDTSLIKPFDIQFIPMTSYRVLEMSCELRFYFSGTKIWSYKDFNLIWNLSHSLRPYPYLVQFTPRTPRSKYAHSGTLTHTDRRVRLLEGRDRSCDSNRDGRVLRPWIGQKHVRTGKLPWSPLKNFIPQVVST